MATVLEAPGWNLSKGKEDEEQWLAYWKEVGEPRHLLTDDNYNLFGACGKPLGWMSPGKFEYHEDESRPLCPECQEVSGD